MSVAFLMAYPSNWWRLVTNSGQPCRQSVRVRLAVAVTLVPVLLAGCSKQDDAVPAARSLAESATSTTAAPLATTSSTTAAATGDCSNRPPGSSAAAFDGTTGAYAAQNLSVDVDGLSLTFNVVQWLSGDDARRAWRDDHPDDPDGPPNDYYIVDENHRLRTASISREAEVFLTHLGSDGTPLVEPDSVDGLDRYLGEDSAATFWLTFRSSVITEICEQYRP